MDIVKIIGVGFIAVIISIILKQYRPEFTIYVAIIAGTIIILMLADKIMLIINEINAISQKANINTKFIGILLKMPIIQALMETAIKILP